MKKLKTVKEIAKWMKETAESMHKEDNAGCASFFIDPKDRTYSLSIGWMSGYGPVNKSGDFRSKSDPDYALNAAIVKYNPSDCCDLECMEMPCREGEDVWNDMTTLGESTDWNRLASFFKKEYSAIVKEYGTAED